MAKRSIHNADLSRKYTAQGRHYNDGRAVIGPIRNLADTVRVQNFEDAERFNAEMYAIRRANPVFLSRTLKYKDAGPWPEIAPEPFPTFRPFTLTAKPPVGFEHRQNVRARIAARFNRTPYVPGIGG